MKEITSYQSYRTYLKDYLGSRQSSPSGLSQRQLAKAIGLSPSSLNMIIDGQRNLTLGKTHDLARAMNLLPEEHEYWEALVNFEQAKTTSEKEFYRKRLKETVEKCQLKVFDALDKDLIQDWRTPVLFCYLADLRFHEPDGQINYEKLQKLVGFSQEEVKTWLAKFETYGFVEKQSDGSIHVVFDRLNQRLSRQKYLEKLALLSQSKMRRDFKSPGHYFEGHTLSISQENLEKFKKDYQSLVDHYMSQPLNLKNNNRVAEIFTSVFPVV